MNGITLTLRECWARRRGTHKGVWWLLIAYSLVSFGSPMPPQVTWLEILMGAGMLIGGLALTGPVMRVARQHREATWCLVLVLSLFFLPLCIGLVRGNRITDMMRDVIPFAFMLAMPILLIYSATRDSRACLRSWMVGALIFVGVCTALTFFAGALTLFGSTDSLVAVIQYSYGVRNDAQAGSIDSLVAIIQHDITQYAVSSPEFNNKKRVVFLKLYDPAMLFAAIFLCAWGIVLMVKSWQGWLPGVFLAGAGGAIAYGFMILGLRSYTAFFVLAVLIVSLAQWRERGFYVRFLPYILIGAALFSHQISAISHLLIAKQQIMGSNGKLAEWQAVLQAISASWQSTLFGLGWGSTVNNPILGEATRFTHSMLSYYLLKSGVVGLGILLMAIKLLFTHSWKMCDGASINTSLLIFQVSCIPPLVIGVLFEPTYKMLSYGVIMALFLLVLPVFRQNSK